MARTYSHNFIGGRRRGSAFIASMIRSKVILARSASDTEQEIDEPDDDLVLVTAPGGACHWPIAAVLSPTSSCVQSSAVCDIAAASGTVLGIDDTTVAAVSCEWAEVVDEICRTACGIQEVCVHIWCRNNSLTSVL